MTDQTTPTAADLLGAIERLLTQITPGARLVMRRHHAAVDVCIHPDGARVGDEGKLIGTFYDRGYGEADAEFFAQAPDLVRALLARLRQQEWQPIETAPTDGTWFLAWDRDCEFTIQRRGHGFIAADEPDATHWMPLPDPSGVARLRPLDQEPERTDERS